MLRAAHIKSSRSAAIASGKKGSWNLAQNWSHPRKDRITRCFSTPAAAQTASERQQDQESLKQQQESTASFHAGTLPLERLRNVAIIAHVDHGKTTLVDCLLKQSQNKLSQAHLENVERLMDSNQLEKERGITIFSKTASVLYNGHRINIVDTPGHADFGGEVERVLSMVDGVILVVDATEGPMTQTRFVLSKALQQNLRPLVVFNKVDRPTARINEVDSELLDLFLTLNATDEQMDYPILFASAKNGWAVSDYQQDPKTNMEPLFERILAHVPPPKLDRSKPFSMLVTQLENDAFVGKCYLGRIQSGSIRVGDRIHALDEQGKPIQEGKVLKLFSRNGLDRVPVEEAHAGDIASIAGLTLPTVNSTLASLDVKESIQSIPIDPPTVSMTFTVNDSPLQSEEGTKLTSSMIRDRLFKEIETNVAMKVIESQSKDAFEVRGRGELHLGILIENMRREGFELSVSPPRVIYKTETTQDGKQVKLEPVEEVIVDVPTAMSGSVIQKLSKRKGEMRNYDEQGDRVRITFEIPSRGLLGYSAEFKNETSGQGVLNNIFIGYQPFKGDVDKSRTGSLISTASGVATSYALQSIESRGTLFIRPGEKVYAGMVIGENSKEMDLEVNPVKSKHITNVRSVSKDDTVRLTPPKVMSLEQVLSYVQDDEVVEVTPKSVRIRKAKLK